MNREQIEALVQEELARGMPASCAPYIRHAVGAAFGLPVETAPADDETLALVEELSRLLPAQFGSVLFRLDINRLIADPRVPQQQQRALEVVQWARENNQIDQLRDAIRRVIFGARPR
jgi:hypothetical protein